MGPRSLQLHATPEHIKLTKLCDAWVYVVVKTIFLSPSRRRNGRTISTPKGTSDTREYQNTRQNSRLLRLLRPVWIALLASWYLALDLNIDRTRLRGGGGVFLLFI